MPRGVSAPDRAFIQGRTWTPRVLAGSLLCWYDADDLSTITVSTGVSEWRDKSGNERHMVQATSGNQPALNIGDFNGKNSIKFTRSSSHRLDITSFPTSGITTLTVFMVVKWLTTGTTTTDIQNLIDNNAGTGSLTWEIRDRPDLGNKPLSVVHYTAVGNGATDGVTTGDDTWKIIGGVIRGDTLFVNGNQKGNSTNTNTLTLSANLRLGGNIINGRHYNGSMAEVIIVTDTTAYTRQRIEGYLAWKWGLADQLLSTHPHISRPPMIGD